MAYRTLYYYTHIRRLLQQQYYNENKIRILFYIKIYADNNDDEYE